MESAIKWNRNMREVYKDNIEFIIINKGFFFQMANVDFENNIVNVQLIV